MKTSNKKNYKNYQKKSDKFWRENFMRVLDALYWQEAGWASQYWGHYGVSDHDKKRIFQEFERFQKSNKQLAREEKQ